MTHPNPEVEQEFEAQVSQHLARLAYERPANQPVKEPVKQPVTPAEECTEGETVETATLRRAPGRRPHQLLWQHGCGRVIGWRGDQPPHCNDCRVQGGWQELYVLGGAS